MKEKFSYLFYAFNLRTCTLYYNFLNALYSASILILALIFIVFYFVLKLSLILLFISLPLIAILGLWALIAYIFKF